MRNISFDNPYLLLIIIPLLACILVPIFIAIRKENKSKSVVASTVIHIVLALCITLALAGLTYTSVMTETQVIVVADVSYSANRNLDQVDSYIQEIEKKLPRNSKMSVVVFARESKQLTKLGEDFTTVTDHGFKPNDVAATNISGALNYASTLFTGDVVKRVVLITDGKETRTNASGEMVAAVENLYANNIYIDAIYLDDNLPDDVKEIQISDVEYAQSTYKNSPSYANILIESTYKTENAILDFYIDSVRTTTQTVALDKGFNVVNFELPTGSAGSFDYRFTIRSEADTATANNVYDFTQSVTNNMNVLLVSWDEADLEKLKQSYDPETVIDAYIQSTKVPCTVEELSKYDEIVLSNFDVRKIQNYTSFVESIDRVVSRFGKSLVTMGNLEIQNKEDEILLQLQDMLPVKYGNSDQDPKLYAIVLDTSRSMQNFSRLRIAKQAAIQLLSILNDNDYVMVVNFWGEINVLQAPTKATNREDVAKLINDWDPMQGTMIGTALDVAGDMMLELTYSEKQIMLISDGMSFSMEEDTPVDVVTKLRAEGIITSCIHPAGLKDDDSEVPNGNPKGLQQIAEAGGGKYFPIRTEADMNTIMYEQVAPDMTDSVIEGQTSVNVKLHNDEVMVGIDSLPDIYGYTYAKPKASATTVLTMDYKKSGGSIVEAPLFAYWSYGNGRVSTFTSTFTGDWSQGWDSEDAMRFFRNVTDESIPEQRIDAPYTVNVQYDGAYSHVEVVPVDLKASAVTEATITMPDGSQVTEKMVFDSTCYYYDFETPTIGRYTIDFVYTYGEYVFKSQSVFNISYSPEYDMFEVFDPSSLHAAIRNRGTVSEGSVPSLENDDKEVATYTVRFVAPLMILAAVLYIIDIIIRKLKISDIKSFFKIKPKRGVSK